MPRTVTVCSHGHNAQAGLGSAMPSVVALRRLRLERMSLA